MMGLTAASPVLATGTPDFLDGRVLPASDTAAPHPVGIGMLANRLCRSIARYQPDRDGDPDDDKQREEPDDPVKQVGHVRPSRARSARVGRHDVLDLDDVLAANPRTHSNG